MRQIICEKIRLLWLHLLLLMPFARIHHNQNNQSEPGGVSDGVSVTACAHSEGSSPPLHMPSLGQAQYLQWADPMADKQLPNNQAMRKLLLPPLPITTYPTKTSKQKKINDEKQAKKSKLDRAVLQGGALDVSWSAAEREGEWPGSFEAKFTLFSILLTSALTDLILETI